MLLNAVLIALAMYVLVTAPAPRPAATEHNWRTPQVEPPDFEPFHVYDVFFRPPA
jgi:hypothetical protein